MKGVYILFLAVIVAVYICPARSQRPNGMPRSSTKKGTRPRGAPPVTRFSFSGNRGHSKIRTITKQGTRPSWRSPNVNNDRPRQKIPKPPNSNVNNGNTIGDNSGRRWDQTFAYMTMAGMHFNPLKHPPVLTRNTDTANAHSGSRSAPRSRPHKSRPAHKSAVKQTPVAPTTHSPKPATPVPTTKKPATSVPAVVVPAVVVPAPQKPVTMAPAAPTSTKAQGTQQKPQNAESTPGQFSVPQLPVKLPPYAMNPPSIAHEDTNVAPPKSPAAKVPFKKTTTHPISIKEEYQPISKQHSLQHRKLALKQVFSGTNSKSIPRPPALPTSGNVGSARNPASTKKATYRMYSSWKDAPGVQAVGGIVGAESTAVAGAAHAVAESKATAGNAVAHASVKHISRSSSLSYAASALALAESLFAKARAGNIPMNSPARRPNSPSALLTFSNTETTRSAASNNKQHGHGILSSGTINKVIISKHTTLDPSSPKSKALPYQSPSHQVRSGGSGVKMPSVIPYGSTSRSSFVGGGQETIYSGNGQATAGQGVYPPSSVGSGHGTGHSSGHIGGGQETIYSGNEQATAGQGVYPPSSVGSGHGTGHSSGHTGGGQETIYPGNGQATAGQGVYPPSSVGSGHGTGHSSGHIGGGQETIYSGNGQATARQGVSRTTTTSGHSGAQYGGQVVRSQGGQSNRNSQSVANIHVATPTAHTQIGSASHTSTNEYELNYGGSVHIGSGGHAPNNERNSNQGIGEREYEQGVDAGGYTTGKVNRRDNNKLHQGTGGQALGHTRSITSSMRQAHVQTNHQGSSRGFGSRASSKHGNGEQEVSERASRPNTSGASIGPGLFGSATTGGGAANAVGSGAQTPALVEPVHPTGSGGPRKKPCAVNPVCGSDGFTYMSECFIWTGISKACDGFCPCVNQDPAPPANKQRPSTPMSEHGPSPANKWGRPPTSGNETPPSANKHILVPPTPVKGHGRLPANKWGQHSSASKHIPPTPTNGHGPPPANNWGPPPSVNNQRSSTPTKGHGQSPANEWGPPPSSSKHIPPTPTRGHELPPSDSKWGPPPSTNQHGQPPSANKQRRPMPTMGQGPPPSDSKWGPPPSTNQHGSPPSANRMGPPLGESYRTPHSQSLTLPGSRVPPKIQQMKMESIVAEVPPTCRCPRIHRPVCSVLGRTYNNDCLRKCSYDGFKCQGECPCGTNSATYQADYSARPKIYSIQEPSTQSRQQAMQTRQQTTQRRQQTTTRSQGPNGEPINSKHQTATSNERTNGVLIHSQHQATSTRGHGSNGAPSQSRPIDIPKMQSTTYAQLQTTSIAAQGPNGVPVKSHRQAKGPNGVPVVHRQSLQRGIEQESRENVRIHLSKTTRRKPSLRSIGSQNRKPSAGTQRRENVIEVESRGGRDQCHCNDIYSPVCGTDGVTHTNPCELACSGTVGSACNGECPCDPFAMEPMYYCEDYCSQSQQPVCSEWGRTYQNDCLRKCSNEAKDCDGDCPCPAAQPQYVPAPSQYSNQPAPYVPQPIQYSNQPAPYVPQPIQHSNQPAPYVPQPIEYNNQPAPYEPHQPQYSYNQAPLYDHPVNPSAYNDPPPQHLLPPTQTRYHTNPNNYNAEPSNQPASTCECTTTDIDPVCTTGGQTYWYGCQAICSGVTIACSSECPC